MKADHPRAIDRYIDFFGEGAWTRVAIDDMRAPATSDFGTVERQDRGLSDEEPRE
jgi:hypothetical protein